MDIDIQRRHGRGFEVRENLDASLAQLRFHITLQVFFRQPQPLDIRRNVFLTTFTPFKSRSTSL
jgi:hypothetical protein